MLKLNLPMQTAELLNLISQKLPLKEKLRSRGKTTISGMTGASSSAILASISDAFPSMLLMTSSTEKAMSLKAEVEFFSGREVSLFPAQDAFPDELVRPSLELTGARLEILEKWERKEKLLVVAPVKAVMRKTVSRSEIRNLRLEIKTRKSFKLEDLIARLVKLGYRRFDIVGEKGEFSVRGGILDVFPVNALSPVRIEFFGDEVESLREFETYSQRSKNKIESVLVLPLKEELKIPIFDCLPGDCLVALLEALETKNVADRLFHESESYLPFEEIARHSRIEFSSLLSSGERSFSVPVSYLNRPEEIPPGALVVSRHGAILKQEAPGIEVFQGELSGGFIFNGIEVLSDRELFGEKSTFRRPVPKAKEGVADELLSDLKNGDYVVHENYGIGIYRGMETLKFDDDAAEQEYLLIEFADKDKLYVPPPMIGLVEKYSSANDAHPRLSRLGTRQWLQTRQKVKESLRELTEELLKLYAAREKLSGFSFPQDDIWQKELESTFPYEETPDQLKAINDVKADMRLSRPMDRLVCGDVGYGKTEVAIRAAAKAVTSGKQVAILAPTTILVEQHFNNFKQRFQNLPFVVEMLSRFRSPAEQKEVVKNLAAGGVDIIIGTHRLLSKDIKFNDLGLLIVDEEQKFGVTHKEKIKKMKETVDVLTLTATPIPRTLYFSLAGVRGISLITTPPVDRSPIHTYVLPFDEKVVRDAVLREIDRGGQVFFLHNFVETIAGFASRLGKLVPEAKIAIGHGQMQAKDLERTMLDFMDKKFDVLVCTSIIESGLDIPNVNTILIDHADRFGLSQLYQIRGRVGRSAARAYAYLFYHPGWQMTDQAVERLKAIQEFTALGSGYKLAMRDLEIRGAGNLLGAQQSGHIYEVGFDLYYELLEEAVKEIKGEKIIPPREVEIDLKIEASIPSSYVADDRQRIALYRRMNLAASTDGIEELKKEIEDRFGRVPFQTENLLKIVHLKVAALKAGVKSVREEKNQIRIEWLSKRMKYINLGKGDKINLVLQNLPAPAPYGAGPAYKQDIAG